VKSPHSEERVLDEILDSEDEDIFSEIEDRSTQNEEGIEKSEVEALKEIEKNKIPKVINRPYMYYLLKQLRAKTNKCYDLFSQERTVQTVGQGEAEDVVEERSIKVEILSADLDHFLT
jgi:hypothetical protein